VVLVTYGVGMLVGAQVAGWIFDRVVTGEVDQVLPLWGTFWWIPAGFAAVVMLFFALFFRGGERRIRDVTIPVAVGEAGP
jgi:hypothetical protein